MARFEPFILVVAALVGAVLIIHFFDQTAAPPAISVATSSPVALATTTTLTSAPPVLATTTTSSVLTPKPTLKLVVIAKPAVQTPSPAPAVSQGALDAAASALRAALVNIICIAPAGSRFHSISASGVMLGGTGYILTNAHVGQYFLLTDQGVSCTIRIGSPARVAYRAALAFIPAPWIRDNATVLEQNAPSGTGERDFAILAVTKSATASPLPTAFPGLTLAFSTLPPGTPVVIASYGAQFLEFNQIETALSPTVVFGSIYKLFTFGTNTVDVLSVSGSIAAQEGSSGGGVIGGDGMLEGDITTSAVTGDTSTRSLSAITSEYIRREYAAETGSTLDILLVTPLAEAIATFALSAPALEAILLAAH